MPIQTDRHTLATTLRSYGEDALADRVASAADEQLRRIFDRADDYVRQDETGLIARALARAAVEVLSGQARPLARSRRDLKGLLPDPVETRKPTEDAEPPREVFLDAATRIAARFEPEGWRFARSGPHVSRAEGPFRFEINLSTSAYNTRGELVYLDAGALVSSRAFKRWRQDQSLAVGHGDSVAAGLLGNLADPPAYLRWNLADPSMRDETIADCIEQIERLALPWFDIFADTPVLVNRLADAQVPNIFEENAIELLVWLGHRDAAEAHARACIARNPETMNAFQQERRRLADGAGFGRPVSHAGERVARAVFAHQLRL